MNPVPMRVTKPFGSCRPQAVLHATFFPFRHEAALVDLPQFGDKRLKEKKLGTGCARRLAIAGKKPVIFKWLFYEPEQVSGLIG
jgi:hypothetical protein